MPEYELIERRREQHIRPGRILACLGLTGLLAGAAWGQPFPNKPVRIVAGEPGGSGDLVARLLAPGLAVNLGQQVVIDNRGGAGGVIAAQTLIKAPTDGHTMLLYGNGIWLLPFMRDNVPYDPVRDFAPVTLAASMPNLLVVHPSLPVRSVKELVALAKARPGELNYGSGSTGAAPIGLPVGIGTIGSIASRSNSHMRRVCVSRSAHPLAASVRSATAARSQRRVRARRRRHHQRPRGQTVMGLGHEGGP